MPLPHLLCRQCSKDRDLRRSRAGNTSWYPAVSCACHPPPWRASTRCRRLEGPNTLRTQPFEHLCIVRVVSLSSPLINVVIRRSLEGALSIKFAIFCVREMINVQEGGG